MTKDEWIFYASGHPEKTGIWKIRPDGTDATRLVEGARLLPEVSPDERFILYVISGILANRATLEVAEIDTGKVIFTTHSVAAGIRVTITNGRPRWMPDGKSFVFVGMDEEGRSGIFQQDFVPGEDTLETRSSVAGFSAEYDVETLGISPDGTRLMISVMESLRSIKLAEGVPGVGVEE